jgi:hypothetical protein
VLRADAKIKEDLSQKRVQNIDVSLNFRDVEAVTLQQKVPMIRRKDRAWKDFIDPGGFPRYRGAWQVR